MSFYNSCEGRDSVRSAAIQTLRQHGGIANSQLEWAGLVEGRRKILDAFTTQEMAYLLVADRSHEPIPRRDAEILERCLLGEPAKAIASDLDRANSTVASALKQALHLLGFEQTPSKLPLGLAGLAWARRRPGFVASVKQARFVAGGGDCTVLGAPLPRFGDALSPAEEAVVRLRVDGRTHAEIADLRRVSRRTVANQLALAFRKLNVSGRSGLIEYAISSATA